MNKFLDPANTPDVPVTRFSRDAVRALIARLPKVDSLEAMDALLPLKHHFSDGVYVREVAIPAGVVVVGAVHKYEHTWMVAGGEVLVYAADAYGRFAAPHVAVSPAGVQRVVYGVTDAVFVTVHRQRDATMRDPVQLRKTFVASDFDEFDNWLSGLLGKE